MEEWQVPSSAEWAWVHLPLRCWVHIFLSATREMMGKLPTLQRNRANHLALEFAEGPQDTRQYRPRAVTRTQKVLITSRKRWKFPTSCRVEGQFLQTARGPAWVMGWCADTEKGRARILGWWPCWDGQRHTWLQTKVCRHQGFWSRQKVSASRKCFHLSKKMIPMQTVCWSGSHIRSRSYKANLLDSMVENISVNVSITKRSSGSSLNPAWSAS